MIRVRLFVEVVSGSGRLAAAVAAAGFHVLCWDINMGPQYDFSKWSAGKSSSPFSLVGMCRAFWVALHPFWVALKYLLAGPSWQA
eukprot:11408220-Heterocapsa_arctica.AAC.1